MKYEILDIITEAYNNDELSAEDAVAYADFVECADLNDGDDVEILTEMVDILAYDDDCYMMEKKTDTKNDSKEKKKSKFKAKLANAKAFVSRNKGKIAAGVLGAAGIAGAGYAAGRTGSNRRHAGVIQGLNDELSKKSADYDKVKNAFKQANAQKRDNADIISRFRTAYDALGNSYDRARERNSNLRSDNSKLLAKVDALQKDAEAYKLHKRADAYSKALAHAGDSIKNRASVNLDDANKPSVGPYAKARAGLGDYIKNRTSVNINDVRNPVTRDQLDELNRKLNISRSNRKRKR